MPRRPRPTTTLFAGRGGAAGPAMTMTADDACSRPANSCSSSTAPNRTRRRKTFATIVAALSLVVFAFTSSSSPPITSRFWQQNGSDYDYDDDVSPSRHRWLRILRPPRISPGHIQRTQCLSKADLGFLRSRTAQDNLGRRPNVADPIRLVTAKFGIPGNRNEGRFHGQVLMHAACVWRAGIFDSTDMYFYATYPDFVRDDPRFSIHRRHERGGGYWHWKPLLIYHHLQELPEGAFVVYMDNDIMVFNEYVTREIETLVERNHDFAINQFVGGRVHLERAYTKGDIYAALGVKEYDDRSQYEANQLTIRNNAGTRKLIERWIELASDFHLISDEPSVAKEDFGGFKENRHDQSLLSMLIHYEFREPGKTEFGPVPFAWKRFTMKFDGAAAAEEEDEGEDNNGKAGKGIVSEEGEERGEERSGEEKKVEEGNGGGRGGIKKKITLEGGAGQLLLPVQ